MLTVNFRDKDNKIKNSQRKKYLKTSKTKKNIKTIKKHTKNIFLNINITNMNFEQ